MKAHTQSVYCLAHHNGYIFSGSDDHRIGVWHGDQLQKFLFGHTDWINSLLIESIPTENSKIPISFLFSASKDQTIRIWSLEVL